MAQPLKKLGLIENFRTSEVRFGTLKATAAAFGATVKCGTGNLPQDL
jgi:hypothetical protein